MSAWACGPPPMRWGSTLSRSGKNNTICSSCGLFLRAGKARNFWKSSARMISDARSRLSEVTTPALAERFFIGSRRIHSEASRSGFSSTYGQCQTTNSGVIMPSDETRRVLRVFGIAVTNYEDAATSDVPPEKLRDAEAAERVGLEQVQQLIARIKASVK